MITYQVFLNFVFLMKYPFTHSHGTNKIKTFSKIYLNIMKYVAYHPLTFYALIQSSSTKNNDKNHTDSYTWLDCKGDSQIPLD